MNNYLITPRDTDTYCSSSDYAYLPFTTLCDETYNKVVNDLDKNIKQDVVGIIAHVDLIGTRLDKWWLNSELFGYTSAYIIIFENFSIQPINFEEDCKVISSEEMTMIFDLKMNSLR